MQSGHQPQWLPPGLLWHMALAFLAGLFSLRRSPIHLSVLSVPRAFHFLFSSFSALILNPHAPRELVFCGPE